MKTKKHRRVPSQTKKKTTRVTIDFPISQHRKLKSKAALEGVTLQEYIRSRVIPEPQKNDILDSELKPIVKKIIHENRATLKRLADK